MYRRALTIVVFAALLAGCGGGRGMHILPGDVFRADPGARGGRSTNITSFNGTLWYGDDRALYGIPLTDGLANTTEIDGSYAGLVRHQSRAMTIARDGTVYELIQNNRHTVRWELRIYAPGSHGASTPEETIAGTGYPQQVTLGVDGINVLWSAAKPGTGGQSTLSTYVYGAGNNPQPVRTFALGDDVSDVAIDTNDRIYVARSGGGGISVYPPRSTCTCAAIRTIATRLQVQRSLAIANDGTVYVLTRDAGAETSYVNVYAPGNDTSTPSRKLGPFYENQDVAPPSYIPNVSNPTGGITVDAAGDVYIGFADAAGHARVEMYTPGATGTPGTGRIIQTPTFSTYLTSIAIGPPAAVAVAPALYVGSTSQILVYATDAAGTATPQRTIGGFWRAPVNIGPGHYIRSSLRSLATAEDGTLDVVLDTTFLPSAFNCRLIVFAANAGGNAPVLREPPCNGARSLGIARAPGGEMDVLIESYTNVPFVQRVVNGVAASTLTLPLTGHQGIAVAPDGTMYLSNGQNRVEKYPPNSASGTVPATFPLSGNIGPMCVAPDGTLYAQTNAAPGRSGAGSDYVYAFPAGATAPARTLGPFADAVTALACDAQNALYVGLTAPDLNSSKVNVYAPNATGAAAPLRTLLNPIPSNDPGGQRLMALTVSP